MGCHIEVSQVHIKATVGSTIFFNARISAPRGCEVTTAAWFRSGRDDRMATYDASTRRWTPSESSVQYRGRVDLSPGNDLGSDGGGTAWLRLRELRMEDDGIYEVKVAWRHETYEWTDSENVFLTVLNPCLVNFSKSRAVVGGSLSFTLTKPPADCRLLNISLQHPRKVDRAWAEPVRILTWDHNSGLRPEAGYVDRVAVVTESKAVLQSVELKGLTREDAEEFMISLWWEYKGSAFNVSWTEHVNINEGSLYLRCVVHQGSPPIYYSWLRGDESSGGNLTETGVHTETWTLHDARHGDAFACEVNNKVGGANTTTERSDIVTVTTALSEGTQHYIYWSPVLIILMLIAITCLTIYHRQKARRMSSPPRPPPPQQPLASCKRPQEVRDHLDGEGVTYASLDDHALNPSRAAQSSRGHLGPGSRDPSHVIYASLQGDGGGYGGDDGDIVAYAALDQWALNRRGPGPTPHAGRGGAGRGADGDSDRVEYARVVVGATDRRGRGGRNGHNGQV
ncbi:uncharacterized protein LOC133339718 [Lethenteron reissneri]|uniref:uncharacterized protein LOC133339718 n=1 Tax=Lethenteron reissneri TaxID=7753 RepID=UPI002AB61627|nr:uncharacterized protein LOC133339718 [Lethenteron reissneri]